MKRCHENEAVWRKLIAQDTLNNGRVPCPVPSSCVTAVLSSINDALEWVEGLLHHGKARHVQLFVTGSLHLVGATLRTLGYTVNDV